MLQAGQYGFGILLTIKCAADFLADHALEDTDAFSCYTKHAALGIAEAKETLKDVGLQSKIS